MARSGGNSVPERPMIGTIREKIPKKTSIMITAGMAILVSMTNRYVDNEAGKWEKNPSRFSINTVVSSIYMDINFVDFVKMVVSGISKCVANDIINTLCYQKLYFNDSIFIISCINSMKSMKINITWILKKPQFLNMNW